VLIILIITFTGGSLLPSTSNAENESDFDWSKVGDGRAVLVDVSVNLSITYHQLVTDILK